MIWAVLMQNEPIHQYSQLITAYVSISVPLLLFSLVSQSSNKLKMLGIRFIAVYSHVFAF